MLRSKQSNLLSLDFINFRITDNLHGMWIITHWQLSSSRIVQLALVNKTAEGHLR